MEAISEGYKKTKIGIIPSDWKYTKFGSFIKRRGKKNTNNLSYPVYSINNSVGFIPQTEQFENSNYENLDKTLYKIVNKNEFAYNPARINVGSIGQLLSEEQCIVSSLYVVFKLDENINNDFIWQYFKTNRFSYEVNSNTEGSVREYLFFNNFSNIKIALPPFKEQQQIAKILTTWDNAISKQEKLIKAKEQLKKGLMQKLLSGEVRFDGFSDKWQFIKLRNLLDYEQPTNYLVANKDYDDSYKTPVLTAGKTFILGYTKEENGIFKNDLPVIIFDDFTTATKFVDFPFKAKSSAMKILKAKNRDVNVKLVFEMMQMINYSAEDHKRYWISEYQELEIKLPSPQEQQKIAQVLSTVDKEIELLKNELESLKDQKKGLIQRLLSGEVRVKL